MKGAQVRADLQSSGVRTILLKGRAFAKLLYNEDESLRSYSDVDLLIQPSESEIARGVMRELGFERAEPDAPVTSTDPQIGQLVEVLGALHGESWLRRADNVAVDIHHTLPQTAADPALVWKVVARRVQTVEIGGTPTDVLDSGASALVVALHAAHHGPGWGTAIEDLNRASARLSAQTWQDAYDIAGELGVRRAMGIGLGLCVGGRAIAERLGLATEPLRATKMAWDGAPWSAGLVDAFVETRGLRRRLRVARHVVWPSTTALRQGSALARRGSLGLIAAYALRPIQLTRRLPGALRARRRRGT